MWRHERRIVALLIALTTIGLANAVGSSFSLAMSWRFYRAYGSQGVVWVLLAMVMISLFIALSLGWACLLVRWEIFYWMESFRGDNERDQRRKGRR